MDNIPRRHNNRGMPSDFDMQKHVSALSRWHLQCQESVMRAQVDRAFGRVLAELIFDHKWYFLFYLHKIQFEIKEMRESRRSLDFRECITLLVDKEIIDVEFIDWTAK